MSRFVWGDAQKKKAYVEYKIAKVALQVVDRDQVSPDVLKVLENQLKAAWELYADLPGPPVEDLSHDDEYIVHGALRVQSVSASVASDS